MTNPINATALEPLYEPWAEPTAHRVRAQAEGSGSTIVQGRRPSPIAIAQNLRRDVRSWREMAYVGASDTTRHLLTHWFERSHVSINPATQVEQEFRYYFCQREALETFIYLKEIRGIDRLSQLFAEYGGADAEIAALGITNEEDLWTRFAVKLATGAGKTKVMSLAIVWSYFHSLRESDSSMARHFVLIAPNLTVYERLKDDFRPRDGRSDIFDNDPLIPAEWRGDWNLSVVLQDEPSAASIGGVLYLTNIHRLYQGKEAKKKPLEEFSWMGPRVSRASALDTGAALRERIVAHQRILILNDEAHHVWDPDSAWNEALTYLHDGIRQRGGDGISAQLDFSATPKDNKGQAFKHVICDTPLGEAVDAAIVKVPIIGRATTKLAEQSDENAAYRYEQHLRLGYARWIISFDEWGKSGKKPLLFVMCDDTESADQIAHRLNTDESFKALNGATINLHTNLKGKVKKIGKAPNVRYEFVESEKDISDEDLQQLRTLSRELDANTSPYRCIVSVLMLREGWDVRNVTTIVPLRPYSAQAKILPEQTLGRGLRRMTPPGQANEIVTVVEHPAFAALYQNELAQEGFPIEIVDIEKVPRTTVSIFPDVPVKDPKKLDITIPRLAAGYSVRPIIGGLTIEDVRKAFKKYQPLPLGGKGKKEIDYEGRHLISNEIIEATKIQLPLLVSGIGAVSFFVNQLETVCRIRGTHSVLAPLIKTYLEEILFDKRTTLFDPDLVARLADADVQEHVRAVFVPLIRARTIAPQKRIPEPEAIRLSTWRPYQVTHSERHPVFPAKQTIFNLVPCNRSLEEAVAKLADSAFDVASFAKNAGPQSVRIDYLQISGQLAFYTPDFFVRLKNAQHYIVETKGREDRDVPRKARAAIAWAEAASKTGTKWEYVYVPQRVFESFAGDSFEALVQTCRPSLEDVAGEKTDQLSLFAVIDERSAELSDLAGPTILDQLPPRYKKAVEQGATLFRFMERKGNMNFAAVFVTLLGSFDDVSRAIIIRRLQSRVPVTMPDQRIWFEPDIPKVDPAQQRDFHFMAQNLKKTLVYNNGLSPLGLLRSCLDFAVNGRVEIAGVFEAVKEAFSRSRDAALLASVNEVNAFRNRYVAHQKQELREADLARTALKEWISTLAALVEADRGTGIDGLQKTSA